MRDLLKTSEAEIEIENWNLKEDRLRKLFTATPWIESAILKEKLKFYESILSKFQNSRDPELGTVMEIVRKECNQMRKALYPKLAERILRKIYSSLVSNRSRERTLELEKMKHSKRLFDDLENAGFMSAKDKIDRYLRLGEDKVSVPVSYYLSENQSVEHTISLARDKDGSYELQGFKSTLHDPVKNSSLSHYFGGDEFNGLNASQAVSLLSGRAVMHEGIWKQFDFKSKNEKGGYPLKEFTSEYGFNAEKILGEMPLDHLSRMQMDDLLDSIKNGNRAAAVLNDGNQKQKIFVEADPQHKILIVYDEKLKKIKMENKSRLEENVVAKKLQLQPVRKTKGRSL